MFAQDGEGGIKLPEQRGNHTGFGWGQASRWLVQDKRAWAVGQGFDAHHARHARRGKDTPASREVRITLRLLGRILPSAHTLLA